MPEVSKIMLGQSDFSGGLNMINPGPNQYKDASNIVIRDGKPTTRPGIRAYLAASGGFLSGFWFNEENAKHNDATHLGFWFSFDFVRLASGTIQGAQIIRLSIHNENKIIFAIGGAVYIYERGYVDEVTVAESIGSTETLEFVQANDQIYLFRSGSNPPLYWDGSETGFVLVPDAVVGNDIPHADNGLFHEAGRMWNSINDDVYASAVLDFTEYDNASRYWTVQRGRGEQGVTLYPFHSDTILALKKNRIAALRQVNAIVHNRQTLADYVILETVDTMTGLVAKWAIVTSGEDIWYLGYGGIYSLFRNQQNKLELDPVPVSESIQPLIDRINWAAVSVSCATVYKNYILFAVPVDDSTTNNMVLVYDRKVNPSAEPGQSKGAWVAAWQSDVLNPVRFFHDDDRLLFLSADHVVRQMFTNDPWDSEDPYADTPPYDNDALYQGGEIRSYESNGDKIFQAIETTQGNLPTDTDYWVELNDQWSVYNITSMIETRQYRLEAPRFPVEVGTAEIMMLIKNPKVTVDILNEDHETDVNLFTDKIYSQIAYEVADQADWDLTNTNLDFNNPHREDYTLLVGTGGMYGDANGLYGGIWETKVLHFIKRLINDRSFGFKITNTQGKLKIQHIYVPAMVRQFATKQPV